MGCSCGDEGVCGFCALTTDQDAELAAAHQQLVAGGRLRSQPAGPAPAWMREPDRGVGWQRRDPNACRALKPGRVCGAPGAPVVVRGETWVLCAPCAAACAAPAS